jgi:hypothetical protein
MDNNDRSPRTLYRYFVGSLPMAVNYGIAEACVSFMDSMGPMAEENPCLRLQGSSGATFGLYVAAL